MGTMSPEFWLILAGIGLAAVAVLAAAWRSVRKAQLDAASTQSMLQRGLSVAEIERLLRPEEAAVKEAAVKEDALYTQFGMLLRQSRLSGVVRQEAIVAFAAADLPAKRTLLQALRGIRYAGGAVTEEWLLTLVRGPRPCGGTQATGPLTPPRSEELRIREAN
jgi:hypothetical protein